MTFVEIDPLPENREAVRRLEAVVSIGGLFICGSLGLLFFLLR